MPQSRRRDPEVPGSGRGPRSSWLWPAIAATGWFWAVQIVALRQHLILFYETIAGAPPAWGVMATSRLHLVLAFSGAVLLGLGCQSVGKTLNKRLPAATGWLLVAWFVPVFDVLRLGGVAIPRPFWEPLLLAGATGAAAAQIAVHVQMPPRWRAAWNRLPHWAIVAACAASLGAWWYIQGCRAYADYMIGFADFAQFGWRVASTWDGRGLLSETPSLGPFWDHFNPVLILFAPLWGVWPDARLFILIQALCLAAPGLLVYAIVRRWGGTPWTAATWSCSYLALPAIGQLNLNYTYGWHPSSVALVMFFAAAALLLGGSRRWAAAAGLVACGCQEDVFATLGWFAFVMGVAAWTEERRRAAGRAGPSPAARLARCMPALVWWAVAGVLALGFLLVFQYAGFAGFQTGRFATLGDSVAEILLSPILRPAVFWGNVFRPRCVYFLLALTIPLGLANVARGWPFALGAALPLGVLLAWDFIPATSIAFQYHTLIVPLLMLGAIAGAAGIEPDAGRCPKEGPRKQAGDSADRAFWTDRGLLIGGTAALAASLTASLPLGAMPWSTPTLVEAAAGTYVDDRGAPLAGRLERGSAENSLVNDLLARIRDEGTAILSTGRLATHLLTVERLEVAGFARSRWEAIRREVGPGRSPIELFDWVVLDTREQFCQSPEDIQFLAGEARAAGYQLVQQDLGILVFVRGRRSAAVRP
ncbi:MAG: DUF2079 domain-containing protein [Pirellulaceae bacterium]|jgi:hypothetical protein|nr:DUF2079 domain-containing protein [Thermoguttaceae bacterium]MDI9443757.1 DUF2079 domain-containing protein [Planctomycetota bacterium]NLZ01452.1 DUF2079 domain-containing protein [Pirellulaceae bacterium]